MKKVALLTALSLTGAGLLADGGSIFTRTDVTPSAWDSASTWLEGESAGYPDQAGCEVWLTTADTKGTTTTTLSGTRTIGAMVMHQSANMDGNFEAEQDKTCTLVLDSGAVGKPCCISNAPTGKFQSSISLGKYGTADGSFTIRLASVKANLYSLGIKFH